MNARPGRATSRRLVLGCLLGLALVPVVLMGACVALSIGAGILNYRDDARDAAAARADPGLQRPLVSSSGRILFLVQTLKTYDAYVVNADGSGLVRLTHTPPDTLRVPSAPVVSPDGMRLARIRDGLSVVRIDRPYDVERLERPIGLMAWSPDARQLASLNIDDQKRLHLNVFNADGTGDVRDLAASWPSTAAGYDQGVREFVWSPDGRRFAFLLSTVTAKGPRGAYRTRTDLYVAPADGSALKNLSLEKDAPIASGGLAWSPDGTRLAFESSRGIATIDSELKWTEFDVQLHPTRTSQRPAWSPDSTRLAWFNPASIVTSDPDGTRQQEVTRGRGGGIQPAWSPDGSRLAFVCDDFRGLCVMNSDGSGLTRVIDLRAGGSAFERDASRLSFPGWLPDRGGTP